MGAQIHGCIAKNTSDFIEANLASVAEADCRRIGGEETPFSGGAEISNV